MDINPILNKNETNKTLKKLNQPSAGPVDGI
jgi:hypothetical protein